MSDVSALTPALPASPRLPASRGAAFEARLKQRYAAERRFRRFGFAAIAFSALVLGFLLLTMTNNAVGGFQRAELAFPLDLAKAQLTVDPSQLAGPQAIKALETAGLPPRAARSGGPQPAAGGVLHGR